MSDAKQLIEHVESTTLRKMMEGSTTIVQAAGISRAAATLSQDHHVDALFQVEVMKQNIFAWSLIPVDEWYPQFRQKVPTNNQHRELEWLSAVFEEFKSSGDLMGIIESIEVTG